MAAPASGQEGKLNSSKSPGADKSALSTTNELSKTQTCLEAYEHSSTSTLAAPKCGLEKRLDLELVAKQT